MSPSLTPRRLLPDVPAPAGLSARDVAALQRQQEAALQRVLEEEILKEMTRENTLQQVTPTLSGTVVRGSVGWLAAWKPPANATRKHAGEHVPGRV